MDDGRSNDDTGESGIRSEELLQNTEAGQTADDGESESDRGFRVEGNVVSVNSEIAELC